MEKGRILFLNGVTSTGKTSIAKALADRDEPQFYILSNDLFQQTVSERHLRSDYWTQLGEALTMMYHTAKLYSDMGKQVIIDGMLLEREGMCDHYPRMLEILADNPLDVIEVYCPLDICRVRNRLRGNRGETQSEEQARFMTKNITYRMRVETHRHSPTECAEQIMRGCNIAL